MHHSLWGMHRIHLSRHLHHLLTFMMLEEMDQLHVIYRYFVVCRWVDYARWVGVQKDRNAEEAGEGAGVAPA